PPLPYTPLFRSPHPGEYLVDNSQTCRFSRNETSHLRHQNNQSSLSQQSRLTGHVRTGDNDDLLRFAVQENIVCDVISSGRQVLFNHRMTAAFDIQGGVTADFGATVVTALSNQGKIE